MIAATTGRTTITLDAGHAEYGFKPASAYSNNEDFLITWFSYEDDRPEDHEENLLWRRAFLLIKDSPNNWLDDSELENPWTNIVQLTTNNRNDFLEPFRDLASQLLPSLDPFGYTPGGDDDYYDYYPSGMRLLREFAIDLDQIFSKDIEKYGPDKGKPRYNFLRVYTFVAADFIRHELSRWEGPSYDGETPWTQEEVELYTRQLMEYYNIDDVSNLEDILNVHPSEG